MRRPFFALISLILCSVSVLAADPQLGMDSVSKVVAAMTLEEKAHLVVGVEQNFVPGAVWATYAIPRFGITTTVLSDGPAGLRIEPHRANDSATYFCTHFPVATVLSSTWNLPLVEQVGKAIGNEALEYGVDVLLAPAMNIHRNPLCGRNFEYYSEDPLLSGSTASAYIAGVQSNGVGVSVKHFSANNQETNRGNNDACISQRALREIYLRGFEQIVKTSNPWTIMSSFNYINGTYASESHDLLTSILRGDWGYKGMVMTDWGAGSNPVKQMQAGNDLLEPGTDEQFNAIVAAVKNGSLDEKVLDDNVTRILSMIVKSPRFRGYKYSNKPDLVAHAAITRQSSTEGMVLLKNDSSALPLAKSVRHVALFGCESYDFIAGGEGSGNVNHAYVVSLLDGLKNAGFLIDDTLRTIYTAYNYAEAVRIHSGIDGSLIRYVNLLPEEMSISDSMLAEQVKKSDVALITLGRISSEGYDRDSSDFSIHPLERALIERTCKAFHAVGKKVIVVLNIGGPIEMVSWRNLPDAILLAWQPGQEGGNSVADVLTGKVSPSGRLPMTWAATLDDYYSTANFPVAGLPLDYTFRSQGDISHGVKNVDYTDYAEDIYVGYRYFDTFEKSVVYPFGYGLSYTTFSYSNASVRKDSSNLIVSVMVKNTGKVAGKEVVEVYFTASANHGYKKSAQELCGFAKTDELKPGESQIVDVTIDSQRFASFDVANSQWLTDAGTYLLHVGASSRDIRAELATVVPQPIKVKVSNSLEPYHPVDIDLGLSVKWASCNVGAIKPEEYGGLFGWADAVGSKTSTDITDYPSDNPPSNISGTEYDIAKAKFGSDWRLPTADELSELNDKCTWTWTTVNGISGKRATGPNGNSIFIPAAGNRRGTAFSDVGKSCFLWCGNLINEYGIVLNIHEYDQSISYNDRSVGMSIRPVLNSQSEINGTLIDARPKYYQVGANLIFDDLKENSNIRIFSVEGRLFNSVVASGDFELNMDYLPKGIYVVRINDYSGKIVIK